MPPGPEDKLPGEHKRSPLGLSPRVGDADPSKVRKIWDSMRRDVHRAHGPQRPSYLGEMSVHTITLPYFWDRFPEDYTKYLKQELFDGTMTNILEYDSVINWCPAAVQLYPLWATGDGNCLLHAISLALWGVEDRDLRLRHLLYDVMKGDFAAENECRWRRERNTFDSRHIPGSGFRYNTTEWSAEWKMVVELSSPEQRINDPMHLPFDCLEEFHIFIMSNILRRPIIVLAGDMWRDASGRSLQPLNFKGIYLPLSWDAKDCCRYPIILGYHQMHFSPLVYTAPEPGQESSNDFLVPLVDQGLNHLPIHFLKEEEESKKLGLLNEYLVPEFCEVNGNIIPCATLSVESPKKELDVFASYMNLAETRYRMYTEEQHNPENAEVLKAAGIMSARNTQQLNEKVVSAGSRKLDDSTKPTVDDALGNISMKHPQPPPCEDLHEPLPRTFPGRSQRTVWQGAASSVPTTVSDPTIVRASAGAVLGSAKMKCSTPGCQYLRAIPTDEYCNSCYKAQSAVGKETFKPCSTESCLNGGDREYGGMCQVCYDQSKFMNDDTAKPTSKSPRSAFTPLSAHGPVLSEVTKKQHSSEALMEVESSTANNLNTTVINTFEFGSKKCRSAGCDFTGNPRFSGMCSKCFNREQGYKAGESMAGDASIGSLAESPPEELAFAVGKKKCLMPECPFTGHPETNDLCSGCYNKQTQLLQKTKASGMQVKIPSPEVGQEKLSDIPESPYTLPADRQRELWQQAKPEKCLTKKCDMFGQQSQKGLCSKCYKISLGDNSSSSRSQSPKRASMSADQTQTGKSDSLQNGNSGSNLQFTVKKNMCATPGCNGVRVQLGEGDLCVSHYSERTSRYSPKVGSTTSSPSSRIGNTTSSKTKVSPADQYMFGHAQAAAPSHTSVPPQPSAPPQSIYPAQYNQAYHLETPHRQEGSSYFGERQQQGTVSQSGATRPAKPKLCTHPKCCNLVAPPLFVACEDCISFVKKFNNLMTAYQEVAGPPAKDEELPMEYSGSDLDELPADNLKNLGPPKSPVLEKFQFGYIKRTECEASGGCPYKMYGDPSYGNLCSKCFDRDVVGNYSSSTAPVRKSARQTVVQTRSQSEVISGVVMVPATRSKTAARPANFQECSSPGCKKQANPNILEGYCNDCYPAYETMKQATTKTIKSSTSKQKDVLSTAKASSSSSSARKELANRKYYTTESGGRAAKCKTKACKNFGNSHSRGYCNACFQQLL